MSLFNTDALALQGQTFTFPSGRTIPLGDILYNEHTGEFTYGPADLTGLLSLEQKEMFPGFDLELNNALMSERYGHGAGVDPGPTNLAALTAQYVTQDMTRGGVALRNFLTGENLDPDTGAPRTGTNWLTLKNVAIVGGLWWAWKKLS